MQLESVVASLGQPQAQQVPPVPLTPQVPQGLLTQAPMQMPQLMQQLQPQAQQMFAEPQQNEFQESLGGAARGFMTVRANTLLLVAGLVAAATIGGYLERAFPKVGKYGTLVAGVLIVVLGRRNTLVRSLGMGVFLAGVAEIVRQMDFISGLGFQERPFEETRVTYGGADGMIVTSPDRRTVT